MKEISGVVMSFGKIVESVKKQVIEQMISQEIRSEPSITDRFLALLRHEINVHGIEIFRKKGLTIRATTLQDRGKNSEERQIGADFAILLDINVEGFQLKKGFLCQAKTEKKGITLDITRHHTTVIFSANFEFRRLQEQTHNMLQITPDSFVMIYGEKDFLVVPASSVEGLLDKGSLYAKIVDDFFMEFLMCFIGDPSIDDNPDHLRELKKKVDKIIRIDIREDERRKHSKKEKPSPIYNKKLDLKSNEISSSDRSQKFAPLISR
ncbi:MAG: hypothetical protein HY223_06355 [Thaumarchaeota archaeon]|nr:hypothetical protein [Nitrososphaerota archaeon]